jgi:hypothetical protein
MAGRPTISVLIPLYNKQDYVSRCLASVRAQTCRDYQIVIVDDGSTDDSARLAAEFLSDSDILLKQTNAGASAARNKAMAIAEGEILAFLDADDEWQPSHLDDILEVARRLPEAGFFATGYEMRSAAAVVEMTIAAQEPAYIDYFRFNGSLNMANASNAAIHRKVLPTVEWFPEGEVMGEEADFFNRLSLKWPLAFNPRITAIYHRNVNDSVCRGYEGSPHEFHCRSLMTQLQDGQVPPELRHEVEEFIAQRLLWQAQHHLNLGDRGKARELLQHRLLQTPRWRPAVACWTLAARIAPPSLLQVYRRWCLSRWNFRRQTKPGQIRNVRVL